MMKRKLTQALMLTAMFVGVGSLSSCKDYDEDAHTDIYHVIADQNATLTDLINAKVQGLQAQIDALKAAQDECKNNCATKIAELEALIQQLQQQPGSDPALQSKVDQLANDVASLQTSITTLGNDITTLTNLYNELKPRVEKNEQDIATLLNWQLEINQTLIQVQSDIEALKGLGVRVEALENAVTAIPGMQTDIQQALNDAAAAQSTANTALQNITNLINLLDGYNFDDLDGHFVNLKDYVDSLAKVSAKNFQTAIALAEEANEALKLELLQEITAVDEAIREKLAQDIQAVIDGYKEADDVLREEYTQQFVDVNIKIGELNSKYDALVATDNELQGQINALKADVAENKAAIEKLTKSQASLITSLVIQEVNNPVFGGLTTPFGINSNVLMGYYGYADKSEGYMFPETKGSGIYAYNEEDASLARILTDEDLEMLSLADNDKYEIAHALYNEGENKNEVNLGKIYLTVNPTGVDFTGTQFDLVNSRDVKSPVNLSPLKPADRGMSFGIHSRAGVGSEASNGFYQTTASLPKSALAEEGVDLDNMVEGMSDAVKDVLHFVKGVEVNKNGLHSTESLDLSKLASAIRDNMVEMDALGLRASWSDPLLGQRSVYSNYGMASIALKSPFNYGSFSDLKFSAVPGYDAAWNLIDRVANKVNNVLTSRVNNLVAQWPEAPEIQGITITGIDATMPGQLIAKFDVNLTIIDDVTIDGYHYSIEPAGDKLYYRQYGNEPVGPLCGTEFTDDTITLLAPTGTDGVYDEYNVAIRVDVDLRSEVQDLYAYLVDKTNGMIDQVEDVNKLVDTLNDYLADVNGVLDAVNQTVSSVTSGVDSAANLAQKLLQKVNNVIVNRLNNLNTYLQPLLLTSDDNNGTHIGGHSKWQPTAISETTHFVMTNMTAEILCPAVRKHLAVTNVYTGDIKRSANAQDGDAKCKEALVAVNNSKDFNVVKNGDTEYLTAHNFKKGYVYELALSCLDYSGQQSTRKFYVYVK